MMATSEACTVSRRNSPLHIHPLHVLLGRNIKLDTQNWVQDILGISNLPAATLALAQDIPSQGASFGDRELPIVDLSFNMGS